MERPPSDPWGLLLERIERVLEGYRFCEDVINAHRYLHPPSSEKSSEADPPDGNP